MSNREMSQQDSKVEHMATRRKPYLMLMMKISAMMQRSTRLSGNLTMPPKPLIRLNMKTKQEAK
jgi:hypothetical protein